jgi:hypothetical protein
MMPTTTKSSTIVNARGVGVRSARVEISVVVGVVIGVNMDPEKIRHFGLHPTLNRSNSV